MPSAKARIGITTPACSARRDASVRESGNIAPRMLPTVESAASVVAVIGAGSWGTTVAAIVSEHAPTTLWGRNPELVEAISDTHENSHYLAGHRAARRRSRATTDLAAACAGADVVVMAVPSHGYRGGARGGGAARSRADVPVVSLAKGIERDTLLRMTEVTLDVLPATIPDRGRGAHRPEPRARGRRGPAGGVGDRVPRRADRRASCSSSA